MELAAIQRRNNAEEREKQAAAKHDMDEMHALDVVRNKAIQERKITLDWAWVAAEFINESGVTPNLWTYEYTKRRGLFGKVALQGIAAEGWHLLDWKNTYYDRVPRYTLILTPQDANNSGIHLSYFSELVNQDGTPREAVLPNQVHPLSQIPFSENDMPWPETVTGGSYESLSNPIIRRPWKNSRSLRYNDLSRAEILKATYEDFGQESEALLTLIKESLLPTRFSYERYAEQQTEKTIRSAIAQVAAELTSVKPRDFAARLKELPVSKNEIEPQE